MKKAICLGFCLIAGSAAFCQSAEDSVKAVVNQLFTAMKTGDEKLLINSFADSAVLQTIAKSKDGKVSIKNEEVAGFAKQVATLPKGDADERITFDMVKVDDDLAIVWAPYKFFYKGTFSHCGIDSFQLVRVSGKWKIQYLIDTRRKDNCK